MTTRSEWHNWLKDNHSVTEEVWLVYYKKPSGKPRIPYFEAVEEALCFGWIDGKLKKINEDYYIQRFTPRRPRSRWSKCNVERIEKLIKSGQMRPEGLRAYENAIKRPELIYDNKTDGDPVVPADLLNALKDNNQALTNFSNFSQSIRRLYIGWLNSAKKAETRPGRILKIVERSEKNLGPGMM